MSVRAIKNNDNLNNQKHKIVKENKNQFRRRAISNPNLSNLENRDSAFKLCKKRFKSECDIFSSLMEDKNKQVTGKIQDKLINSKSEVCLKTIAVHTRIDKLHPYQKRGLSNNDLVNSRSSLSSSAGVRDRIPIIGYEVMEERARFTVSF